MKTLLKAVFIALFCAVGFATAQAGDIKIVIEDKAQIQKFIKDNDKFYFLTEYNFWKGTGSEYIKSYMSKYNLQDNVTYKNTLVQWDGAFIAPSDIKQIIIEKKSSTAYKMETKKSHRPKLSNLKTYDKDYYKITVISNNNDKREGTVYLSDITNNAGKPVFAYDNTNKEEVKNHSLTYPESMVVNGNDVKVSLDNAEKELEKKLKRSNKSILAQRMAVRKKYNFSFFD
ncbi:hypothetical protein Emin_0723 [Elusimicrobium minutum Pei191]|uniref:Uncharacterized protein n=1 Tax=Elusimicrobium minutum (strain Pei191) TaxID=445932 RepID=B2KCN2_ELUMP|nr:hypothetical protein [Elusimicrobium minutum]ACC98278.1 hypothetical protein Emin_0723 [Elusimicrobium minutum Pei191]